MNSRFYPVHACYMVRHVSDCLDFFECLLAFANCSQPIARLMFVWQERALPSLKAGFLLSHSARLLEIK